MICGQSFPWWYTKQEGARERFDSISQASRSMGRRRWRDVPERQRQLKEWSADGGGGWDGREVRKGLSAREQRGNASLQALGSGRGGSAMEMADQFGGVGGHPDAAPASDGFCSGQHGKEGNLQRKDSVQVQAGAFIGHLKGWLVVGGSPKSPPNTPLVFRNVKVSSTASPCIHIFYPKMPAQKKEPVWGIWGGHFGGSDLDQQFVDLSPPSADQPNLVL